MTDTSPVQKVVTWAVIILLVILGVAVLVNDKPAIPNDRPVTTPTSGPEPIPVYPNNGKE
jgi:hypothetical protein